MSDAHADVRRALVATAPDELRDTLRQLSLDELVTTSTRWRPGDPTDALAATRVALRSIARRHLDLTTEIEGLNHHLDHLVATVAPNLVALHGVGTDCAGQLLVTAGDNPDRLRNEAAFSHLCGASPIPASSGRVIRHRLNRAGDRQANAALYRIVITRLRWHTPTRDYVQRRTGATLASWTGASTKELMSRLGHSTPRAALRYQHAAQHRDREIADRLGELFEPDPG